MKAKRIRNLAFPIHRYLGLALGLLLILIGITGSLLVFEREIDPWLVSRQIGNIIPQGEMVKSDRVFQTVQAAYPGWKIDYLRWSGDEKQPLRVDAISPDSKDEAGVYLHGIHTIFVNPYTGEILGDRSEQCLAKGEIAGITGSVMIVLADTWEIRTIGTIEPIVPQMV